MISTGVVNERRKIVTIEDTARFLGSGTLPVFATPAMMLLIEETALESIASELPEGDTTVGTLLDIKHTSPSPVGMEVVCRTELKEVDRARLRFEVIVRDSKGEIGVGYHERFVVHGSRFMEKAEEKML
jgi:fluoroacetyl-CoA thioesterase